MIVRPRPSARPTGSIAKAPAMMPTPVAAVMTPRSSAPECSRSRVRIASNDT